MTHLTIPSLPEWVEPAAGQDGSIDPLRFLAEADYIAERLLPGVTVVTTRIRYLSFLCWAIHRTQNSPNQIDRWEIALSIGEFTRHSSNNKRECKFLGSRLLKQKRDAGNLRDGGSRPDRLHQQTARILYSGLLRSCDLIGRNGELSDLGKRLATQFDSDVGPNSLPARNGDCRTMPCLSNLGKYERRSLYDAFFGVNDDGARRRETLNELGKRSLSPTSWTLLKNIGHDKRRVDRSGRKTAGPINVYFVLCRGRTHDARHGQ